MNCSHKFILLLLAVLGSTIRTNAQPVMGLQGGFNVSALSGHKPYDENKYRYGISAYAFTDIPFGRNSIVSLETGLTLSMQGMRHQKIIDNVNTRITYNYKNQLDYLILPIYFKENFNNFYTKIGPYGGYLLNAKSKINEIREQLLVEVKDSNYVDDFFKQKINTFDYGVSVGFGFIHFFEPVPRRFRNARRKRQTPVITIDFKYNLGLASIDATGKNADLNLKNRTFTLGITLTSIRD